MTTEHWQQVKEIFHAALERDAAERPAFIAQACRDNESIRSQVDSLIAAHEKEGTFIDSPAYELAADWLVNEPVEPLIGRLIYHYRIVDRIAAGGMGEVYLAEDTKLGRKIALKILPASFPNDSDRLH